MTDTFGSAHARCSLRDDLLLLIDTHAGVESDSDSASVSVQSYKQIQDALRTHLATHALALELLLVELVELLLLLVRERLVLLLLLLLELVQATRLLL